MAAFTINSTVTVGEYTIVDAYSADVSTAQALVAAKAGHSHRLKSITIDINHSDTPFEVYNDSDLFIGPVRPRANVWHRRFEGELVFSGAINVKTSSDKQIHVIAEYRTVPTTVL